MGELLRRRALMAAEKAPVYPKVSFDGTYTDTGITVTITNGNHIVAKNTDTWTHHNIDVMREDGEPWFIIPNGSILTLVSPTTAMPSSHDAFAIADRALGNNGSLPSVANGALVGKYGNTTSQLRATYKNTTGSDVAVMSLWCCVAGNWQARSWTRDLVLELNGQRIVEGSE